VIYSSYKGFNFLQGSDMDKDVETVSLHDIITDIMDAPLKGGKPPSIHKKITETKKLFFEYVFEEMLKKISDGKRVRIKNVGVFSLRVTKEKARNPSNNEQVEVINRKRLKFEPSTRTIPALNKEE
jgi:nucleoid DNA-binding protein